MPTQCEVCNWRLILPCNVKFLSKKDEHVSAMSIKETKIAKSNDFMWDKN